MRKLVALLVVAGASLLPSLPAAASTGADQHVRRAAAAAISPSPLGGAAAWLAAQVDPGGFVPSSVTPGTADLGLTAQAVLALSAARLGGTRTSSMETYLAAHVDDYVKVGGVDQPARLAFLILGAVANGNDPTTFGGADLVARLEATQQPSGLFGAGDPTYDGAYRQGFSLLALQAVGHVDAPATAWLQDQQCDDGGWTAYRADTSVPCPAVDPSLFTGPDTNSTALAAEALHAGGAPMAHDAVTWLEGVRAAGGGFAFLGDPTQPADANSTGIVVQALDELTGAPDTAGEAALAAFQAGCAAPRADIGGVAYQPTSSGDLFPDVLATIQALWGLARTPFPLAEGASAAGVPALCATAPATSTTVASTSTVAAATTSAPATTVVVPVSSPPAQLAATGAHDAPLVALGAALAAAGGCLVLLARRRAATRP